MPTGLKGRIMALLLAAALIGSAVLIRVWLAATGGYSQEWSLPFRGASGIALFAGLLLAAIVVAWPVRKPGGPAKPGAGGGP